jgi:hypothetical protein
MNENKVSFLGSILKAVASTPHAGDDLALYQRTVVEPSKRWRRQLEDHVELSDVDKREVILQLLTVFETKRVPTAERQDRIREILALHDTAGVLAASLPPEARA